MLRIDDQKFDAKNDLKSILTVGTKKYGTDHKTAEYPAVFVSENWEKLVVETSSCLPIKETAIVDIKWHKNEEHKIDMRSG